MIPLKQILKPFLIATLSLSLVFLAISTLETTSFASIGHQNPITTPSTIGFSRLITTTSSFSPSIFKLPIKSLDFEQIASLETTLDKAVNISPDTYPYYTYGSADFFFPPYLSDSDRMGYGLTVGIDPAILSALKAGWYINWGASLNPSHPGGVEYARHVYMTTENPLTICAHSPAPATQLSQISALTGTALLKRVQANPGSLWLIGNEPDSIYFGHSIQAEIYAELYHYFYARIKEIDPTAKVAMGAVAQVSPLRMKYLDRILTHYQSKYNQPLPTDLWNVHFYRLNEVKCSWGANVPPFEEGPGWDFGSDFSPENLLNLTELTNHLKDFRRWMYDRGYGDKPLIITEWGGLLLPEHGYTEPVSANYLEDMTNIFLTLTDPTTGYAADGDRLVQMWAWFSTRSDRFGGDLFDVNNNVTIIGERFIDLTTANYTPYTDLQPIPPVMVVSSTNTLNVTAYLKNRGNTKATDVQVALSLIEASSGETVTTIDLDLGDIQSRYVEPPTLIDHTWQLSFTQVPTITVPYTLTISMTSPDANAANDHIAYPVNWFPLLDLAVVDLDLSSSPNFSFREPTTFVVTATVANVGIQSTPGTVSKFTLEAPNSPPVELTALDTVPPLQPVDTWILTATVPITQAGAFTVSAALPATIGPAEIINNNRKAITIRAFGFANYLPLIVR